MHSAGDCWRRKSLWRIACSSLSSHLLLSLHVAAPPAPALLRRRRRPRHHWHLRRLPRPHRHRRPPTPQRAGSATAACLVSWPFVMSRLGGLPSAIPMADTRGGQRRQPYRRRSSSDRRASRRRSVRRRMRALRFSSRLRSPRRRRTPLLVPARAVGALARRRLSASMVWSAHALR